MTYHKEIAGASTPAGEFAQAMPAGVRLRLEHVRTLGFAIKQCDPRDACHLMAAALDDLSAGMPGAPLFSYMDQADWWADLASEPELKAYLMACWNRLSPKAKASFLRHIERKD